MNDKNESIETVCFTDVAEKYDELLAPLPCGKNTRFHFKKALISAE